ncbi:tyrosine-type recombinase/integrase [Azospirillum sp.]|uniref:tyrosine-type recombinase/integrase n=1 Tax=Azospirillum sp. TaxID=34012 RepID=UPI002D5FA095|nr:tyrosine-type recombinase/integrase [Azospirillum sp.]HYD66142.1 tyrosine-type recombinase/integrase [Azospirillum sp.]
MSVFRVKGSPYFQFDFQLQGHRFYGSTRCTNEREAREDEKARRAEAAVLVKQALAAGRKPMTFGAACDRWWDQVGSHGSDPDLKRALDWLKDQIGHQVALHTVNDDMVSRAVEARRKCVMRAGRDAKGTQLYRPLSARTVNKTVPSLLRRVMNRARKAWSVAILVEPNWKEHFLAERKRPVREITAAEDAALDGIESLEYAGLREFAEIMGLRRKELLLTWPQVDFDKATISIIGKGGVPAILPLTKRAYHILWGLRGHDKMHVFTFVAQRTRRCPKTKRDFVKGQRYPMTYFGIGTNRRRKWSKAGVDARLHDTRHTTGQRALRTTGNLRLVQQLLRHTEIRTTAKFYTDTTMADLRAGMEAVEQSKPAKPDQPKKVTGE